MVLFKISICMFPQTQYKFNIGINCKKKNYLDIPQEQKQSSTTFMCTKTN